ncbi:hypothetical protein DFAR_3370011 [Desulfarculales bacterium]
MREELAELARMAFDMDVLYRRWDANLGEAYALATLQTPPNPYLHGPECDIATPLGGMALTLIKPGLHGPHGS